MQWKQRLAGIPGVGYLLKLGHDLARLPVIRRDLHLDNVHLSRLLAELEDRLRAQIGQSAADARSYRAVVEAAVEAATLKALQAAQAAGVTAASAHDALRSSQAETALIKGHFATILEHMANTAASLQSMQERIGKLQEYTETLAAAVRRDRRAESSTVVQRVEELSQRLDQFADTEEELANLNRQIAHSREQAEDAAAERTIVKNHLSCILEHIAATLRSDLREAAGFAGFPDGAGDRRPG